MPGAGDRRFPGRAGDALVRPPARASPLVSGNLLALVYRAIWDIHSFTGLHPPQAAYALGLTCLYAANVFGLCGTAVLCRTFRAMVRERAGLPHADPSPFPETGVWPPPPTPPV